MDRHRGMKLGCALWLIAAAWGCTKHRPADEGSGPTANVLSDGLHFTGGAVDEGAIAAASDGEVTLSLVAKPELVPSQSDLLSLDYDNPDEDDNPAIAMLLRFGAAAQHARVPTARSVDGPGELNFAFSVDANACNDLCAALLPVPVAIALELDDGTISSHLKTSFELDCRKHGEPSACSGSGSVSGGSGAKYPEQPSETCEAPPDVIEINTTSADKVDLLFVVDNSGSMTEEQASLREQFPHMIAALTSGNPGNGGPLFPPVKDLHLGVVSTDLGLVGISDIDRCVGLGNDGIMQNEPRLQGCKASYPRFLTYNAGLNSPSEVANDFSCIAMLGTEGCGFEQQLEVGLKALWPGSDNRITFLGDFNNFGTQGHGDTENQGFLRNDPVQGLSVIAIVLVTDEEDCSSQSTVHFTPNSYLDPQIESDAKLLQQGLNTRCFLNQQNLYQVQRYTNGFKALRPGNEDMVVFSAIVGVPPETVDQTTLGGADWEDAAKRDEVYEGILNHPLMQLVVEQNGTDDPGDDTMRPSCNTSRGVAYPPRRIVETARGFGHNGLVQSICQEDFTPAMDAIVNRIGRQLSNVGCLPRALERNAQGSVGCDVIWELPAQGMAPRGTPTECSALPFLSKLSGRSARGGARCRVAQLPVTGDELQSARVDGASIEDGWFYDDFSVELATACSAQPQRVSFTPQAKPPTAVTVKLECPATTKPSAAECAKR